MLTPNGRTCALRGEKECVLSEVATVLRQCEAEFRRSLCQEDLVGFDVPPDELQWLELNYPDLAEPGRRLERFLNEALEQSGLPYRLVGASRIPGSAHFELAVLVSVEVMR
jgi:hypothetical protein